MESNEVKKEEEITENTSQKQSSTVKAVAPFIVIIILAAVGVSIYLYFFTQPEQGSVEPKDQVNVGTEGNPNYTIEEVPFDIADIAPSLERNIQFSESIPENVRAQLEEQAASTRASLNEDITRVDEWFTLGIVYHTANDYEGAREVWEFLVQVVPNSSTAYDNLAKLYHFSVPDFPKSESYFEQSLSVDPNNINAYLGLHELYRYSYKQETTLAADTLRDAMKAFPEELGLYTTLGAYYRDVGNISAAREVLLTGLDKARDAGNVSMIAALGAEIERLPQ